MLPKKTKWHNLGEVRGLWAWISSDGVHLIWRDHQQTDQPTAADLSGSIWRVEDVVKLGFSRWRTEDTKMTRKLLREWLSQHKGWIALVSRVLTYQEKARSR